MVGRKLVSQSLVYGLASLLINGTNFFLVPFYTYYLSPTEYGIVGGVTVFTTLATSFLTFGLNGSVTRFYFDLDKERFKSFLFTVFVFQLIAAGVVAGGFIALDGLFLDQLYSGIRYEPYLKYGLIAGVMGVFATVPLAALQAQSKPLQYRLFTTSSFIILTLSMIVLVVVMRKGSIGGVWASVIASSVMGLAYTVYVVVNSNIKFNLSLLRSALIFGLPLMAYTIFGALTELSSKYFVERLLSLSELGVFNVAQQISAVMVLVTNAINMAWTPIFYEEATKDETSLVFAMFGKFLIFCLSLAGLGVSLLAPELVELFVSKEYSEICTYIPVLLLAYIIGNGYWILLVGPLNFSKKTAVLPLLTTVSGVVSVGLNIWLIQNLGVMGAALSMLLSYICLVALAFVFFKKYSKVTYNFRAMNFIVVTAITTYALSLLIKFDNIWVSLVYKSAFVFLFCLLLPVIRVYSAKEAMAFLRPGKNRL